MLVDPGDIGSLAVQVLGDRHAEVHPERARPLNRAHLIDETVLITGDEPPGRKGRCVP